MTYTREDRRRIDRRNREAYAVRARLGEERTAARNCQLQALVAWAPHAVAGHPRVASLDSAPHDLLVHTASRSDDQFAAFLAEQMRVEATWKWACSAPRDTRRVFWTFLQHDDWARVLEEDDVASAEFVEAVCTAHAEGIVKPHDDASVHLSVPFTFLPPGALAEVARQMGSDNFTPYLLVRHVLSCAESVDDAHARLNTALSVAEMLS